jgi:hypothetical protein
MVGCNEINYPGKVGTEGAYLKAAKLLLNSVISTPVANFMPLDKEYF